MYYESSDPFGPACLGLVFGGYFFVQGLRLWWEKRDIQNKPLSRIDAVAMGDAEVSGSVKAEKVIQAPFSGQACVYCRYKVEVPQKNSWREVEHGEQHSIFYLDDGTGQILLNPEGATFYGPESYQEVIEGNDYSVTTGITAWLEQQKGKNPLTAWMETNRHRFTEYVIRPEQIVFAEGSVTTARHVVDGKEKEEKMLGKRSSGHFILSANSQEELLTEWALKVPLQIFGGAALLLCCLWFLVARVHLGNL